MSQEAKDELHRISGASSRSERIVTTSDDPGRMMTAHMRAVEGPLGPSNQVRQAVAMVWRSLPADARSLDRVESEVRRLVERTLRDLREDSAAFGFD